MLPVPSHCEFKCNIGTLATIDVNKLIAHLHKHAYKWREIGGALNFEQGELENISHAAGNDPQQLLTKLLTEWSQWPTEDHPTDPTLESLCKALRSGMVGLGKMAKDLEAQANHLPEGM